MKALKWLFTGLVFSVLFMPNASAVDCPGFCTQCRTDAISVCGAGCVLTYSCSLGTCTCSFTCSQLGACHSGGLPVLRDSLNIGTMKPRNEEAGFVTPDVVLGLLAQPEVAIKLADLRLANDPGRQISELRCTVSSDDDSKLKSVRLMLVFFDEHGATMGAESFGLVLETPSKGAFEVRRSLRHYADSGQRVAFAVTDFETEAREWHGDHANIIKAIKAQ